MQSDLIGTNQTKEIEPHGFRQTLQFRSGVCVSVEHYVNEHGRIIAPVKTDSIIYSLDEGIARIPHLQEVDPVRDFLTADNFQWNGCHFMLLFPSIPGGQ